MKTNIYVIYGGKSAEHDISLITAKTVINALDKALYDVHPIYITQQGVWCSYGRVEREVEHVDSLRLKSSGGDVGVSMGGLLIRYFSGDDPYVVMPVIHGTHGEDGTLQGLLEMLNVPYVGNGVHASAIGMDKVTIKRVFSMAGIPQVEYQSVLRHEWEGAADRYLSTFEQELGYPCYVKPANLGSSIGISRCENREALGAAIELAFDYDRKIIVEREVVGREIQLAVIGNNDPVCSVAGEFVKEPEFFDYKRKYIDGNLIQRIPANISTDVYEQMRKLALQAFKILDGSGLMRVDFFLTDRNEVYLNEVNTLPGFTAISMFPALWKQTDGTTYPELIQKLIDLALERHKLKNTIQYGRVER
ncbi:MAG: D-alanine--D-alanine ligase [Paenibacillus sp.]|nr:D-alanine--D-alanine ligase [Paenibacillus sp.]